VWGQSWEQVFTAGPLTGAAEAGRGLALDQELREEARALFLAYRRRLPRALR